jgi:hypothetical protein
MSGKLSRFAPWIVAGLVIAWLVTPVSIACTPPPVEGIDASWPPAARVLVTFDSNLNLVIGNAPAPMATAVNNWNTATQLLCYEPIFTFGVGSGPTMSFAYGPIPNAPNGIVRRGLTTITISTRIDSAAATINSNIPLTFPNVLTETIAHEMGHTMGLNDCQYSGGCAIGSSVMVVGAPVATWTATQGQPGPTICDLTQVISNAPDYECPPPPPPPPPDDPPCDLGFGTENRGPCSPIILDIDGKGFTLTSAQGGVLFDIAGTGTPIQIAWTAASADNAFLALPGSDGLVHTGKELFGNFTPQPLSNHPNGFAALAVYDLPANGGNGDGVIDARDKIFASLRLWIDANHDGICQPDELHTLPSMGVNSISLKYVLSQKTDQYGNVFRYRAGVNPDDPDASHVDRKAYDVFFVTLGTSTTKTMPKPLIPVGVSKCPIPPERKQGALSTGGL